MAEVAILSLTNNYRQTLQRLLSTSLIAKRSGIALHDSREVLEAWAAFAAASSQLLHYVEDRYGYELPISQLDQEELADFLAEEGEFREDEATNYSEVNTDDLVEDPVVAFVSLQFDAPSGYETMSYFYDLLLGDDGQVIDLLSAVSSKVGKARYAILYETSERGTQEI